MGGMMGRIDLPFLNIYTAKGKVFAYYRRAGKRIRLAGEIGTPEFLESYNRAHAEAEMAGTPTRASREKPLAGSLRALVEAFQASREFKQNAVSTQNGYLWVLEWLLPKFGDGKVALMTREWVIRRRDELAAEKPGKANYFTTVMSLLLSWGIDRGYSQINVAARIKKLKGGKHYRAWTDLEIKVFTNLAPATIALPVLIGLYTGQRQSDILKMPWSVYDGRTIRLKQSKAGAGADVMEIPVHPVLKAALDAAPRTAVTICTRQDGHSWKQRHFGDEYATMRTKLGLADDVHFHGLRHTSASRMSEAGASDAQIQAITGHKTRQMVELYTRGAKQKKLAKSAIAHLPRKRIGNTE